MPHGIDEARQARLSRGVRLQWVVDRVVVVVAEGLP